MFKKILVPIDLGAPATWKRACNAAVALGENSNAELHVVCVVPSFGMSLVGSYFPEGAERKAIDETKAKLKEVGGDMFPPGVDAKFHVAHGSIYEEIIASANTLGCDAIVMSAHRPELSDYLLGPNAARVVRHANQTVLVVRD